MLDAFFNFKEIVNQLKYDKVCNLNQLNGYLSINELRLINNCIKHNDSKVDKKLAKYNHQGWNEKEKIVENKNFSYS